MFKSLCTAIIAASLMFIPVTHADEAKAKLRGTSCYGTFNKFRCGYIGEVTISEIYEKGWRVIAAIEVQNFVNLVIEEQQPS